MEPIITIGMPVFNDIDFIEKSIQSILNQSEHNFQLIISDDGATDGSSEVCKKYSQLDNRVKYIRQNKNLGISKNMEFLLQQSNTEYFMWAADDDLWDANFIRYHIDTLKLNPKAIVSFGKYELIDENDKVFDTINFDYTSNYKTIQLLKLIWFEDDGFGYGVFKTNKIKKVKFPIWWWPNKKTPYNNIYPSLCFYLNKGKYIHNQNTLFYKRVKVGANINHTISGGNNGFKELVFYYLRRFYLVQFSFIQILKSPTFYNAILIYPFMFLKWFLYSSTALTYRSLRYKFINFIQNIQQNT